MNFKKNGTINQWLNIRCSQKRISPYLDTKRFQKPKEIFKHSIDILNKLNFKKKKSLVDICCANGEFLYLLKKNLKIGILLG